MKRVGEFCAVRHFKIAIVEGYVFKRTIFSALQSKEMRSLGVDVRELQILDAFHERVCIVRKLQKDRLVADLVHHNIVKQQVFHDRFLPPHVCEFGTFPARDEQTDADGGIGHDDVGKHTIPNGAVVDPTDAYSRGITGQVTVRHAHLFAYGILFEGSAVRAHDDAIVAAGDVAVRDRDVPRAIHMNAVVIRIIHAGLDLDLINRHIITIMDPVRPAGGLILHQDIFDLYILTAGKKYGTGRCRRVDPFILPINSVGRAPSHKIVPVTIDGTVTRQGDMLTFVCENETSVSLARQHRGNDVFYILPLGILFDVGGSEQNGIARYVQFHITFHLDRAAQVDAAENLYATTAVFGARVDRFLNRQGIECFSVAYRAKISYIIILIVHYFSPLIF